jgi:hypothetical protein
MTRYPLQALGVVLAIVAFLLWFLYYSLENYYYEDVTYTVSLFADKSSNEYSRSLEFLLFKKDQRPGDGFSMYVSPGKTATAIYKKRKAKYLSEMYVRLVVRGPYTIKISTKYAGVTCRTYYYPVETSQEYEFEARVC